MPSILQVFSSPGGETLLGTSWDVLGPREAFWQGLEVFLEEAYRTVNTIRRVQ